jgi:hypothetical protein
VLRGYFKPSVGNLTEYRPRVFKDTHFGDQRSNLDAARQVSLFNSHTSHVCKHLLSYMMATHPQGSFKDSLLVILWEKEKRVHRQKSLA